MPDQYKKIAFLGPRPGLGDEAFRAYWREVHGPVVGGSPGYAAYRWRYVQNHILGPGPVGALPAFAGMAEFWLPGDNEDEFASTSIYRDRIRVDELNFIDMDATVSMTAVEQVVKAGEGPAKLVLLSSRAPGLSLDDFRGLLAQYAVSALAEDDFAGRLRGWTMNHVVPGSFRLPGARPVSPLPLDCVEELWFASQQAMESAFASPGYLQHVRPLLQQACSTDNQRSFRAEELVFFDCGRRAAQ